MSSLNEKAILAIEEAQSKLLEILSEAKQLFEKDGENFVDDSIGVLCNGITTYATLFKKCECKDQKDFESLVTKGSLDIKKAAERLLEAEEEWGRFLEEVEQTLNREQDGRPLVKEGDFVDMDIALYPVNENPRRENKTLREISSSCKEDCILLVLNRHFA